jgi:hypothetical protein
MDFYWLALGILAVWRVTHLFHAEDGPWDIMVRFRLMAGRGFFGKLLDCFACTSFWVAIPLGIWIGDGIRQWILLPFALSGGAILLERLTNREPQPPVAEYREDEK